MNTERGLTLTRPACTQCVKLQDEIIRLRAENKSLKDKLRYQQRQSDEGYFGSSTPCAKKPFKPTPKQRRRMTAAASAIAVLAAPALLRMKPTK